MADREGTHYVGDGCQPPHVEPEPRVTAEDVRAAVDAGHNGQIATSRDYYAAVLHSTLRPGGLVARAIADELERLANEAFADDPGALGLLLTMATDWRDARIKANQHEAGER
jgi:hypothetical protein